MRAPNFNEMVVLFGTAQIATYCYIERWRAAQIATLGLARGVWDNVINNHDVQVNIAHHQRSHLMLLLAPQENNQNLSLCRCHTFGSELDLCKSTSSGSSSSPRSFSATKSSSPRSSFSATLYLPTWCSRRSRRSPRSRPRTLPHLAARALRSAAPIPTSSLFGAICIRRLFILHIPIYILRTSPYFILRSYSANTRWMVVCMTPEPHRIMNRAPRALAAGGGGAPDVHVPLAQRGALHDARAVRRVRAGPRRAAGEPVAVPWSKAPGSTSPTADSHVRARRAPVDGVVVVLRVGTLVQDPAQLLVHQVHGQHRAVGEMVSAK